MNINYAINECIEYGVIHQLLDEEDKIYARNRILIILKLHEFKEEKVENVREIHEILNDFYEYAIENHLVEGNDPVYLDLFDTKIMDCLMPRPSEIQRKFQELYQNDKKSATDYYYHISKASNYIRMDRIRKNLAWKTETKYGNLDITVNLSKPEKDPKMIALLKSQKSSSYPKCALCYENVGYEGSLNQPARCNHRVLPVMLNHTEYYLQYSPYVYYNEHCIVFNKEHIPMKISKNTFASLLDFTEVFPHYFLGSNADLPIVGGSILSHDHFQGGHCTFAMELAKERKNYKVKSYSDVKISYIEWPLDCIRLSSTNKEKLVELSDIILNAWRNYSDEKHEIFAYTIEEGQKTPHNTITPIARNHNGEYQLDLVLRNNRTSKEYPDGIFHPDKSLHHIKKENIGLIEVMGLAVLPSRLKKEVAMLKSILLNGETEEANFAMDCCEIHYEWLKMIQNKYSTITEKNIDEIFQNEIGYVFERVLECCSVMKYYDHKEDGMDRFISSLNL